MNQPAHGYRIDIKWNSIITGVLNGGVGIESNEVIGACADGDVVELLADAIGVSL